MKTFENGNSEPHIDDKPTNNSRKAWDKKQRSRILSMPTGIKSLIG
ncbi:MAG: hypothetical protein AAGA02_13780 [Bacteroidota bacterium]